MRRTAPEVERAMAVLDEPVELRHCHQAMTIGATVMDDIARTRAVSTVIGGCSVEQIRDAAVAAVRTSRVYTSGHGQDKTLADRIALHLLQHEQFDPRALEP